MANRVNCQLRPEHILSFSFWMVSAICGNRLTHLYNIPVKMCALIFVRVRIRYPNNLLNNMYRLWLDKRNPCVAFSIFQSVCWENNSSRISAYQQRPTKRNKERQNEWEIGNGKGNWETKVRAEKKNKTDNSNMRNVQHIYIANQLTHSVQIVWCEVGDRRMQTPHTHTYKHTDNMWAAQLLYFKLIGVCSMCHLCVCVYIAKRFEKCLEINIINIPTMFIIFCALTNYVLG